MENDTVGIFATLFAVISALTKLFGFGFRFTTGATDTSSESICAFGTFVIFCA